MLNILEGENIAIPGVGEVILAGTGQIAGGNRADRNPLG
jgi:hypothetical protein